MESKMQKALSSLGRWQEALACPVCGGGIEVEAHRIRCVHGHSWDVNRKGYVNLLSRPHATYYDQALFAARGRLLGAGVYEPVIQALAAYLRPGDRVLDAGCGEGYYLDALSRITPIEGAGIDISRDAIAQAACHEAPQLWLVGDVARLPFKPGSLDVILDILTPASYRAFWQALKPEGLLMKVYPGCDYLKELRMAMGLPAYAAGDVETYARQNARVEAIEEIHKTLTITPQMYRDFVFMPPLTQRLTLSEKEALAGRPQERMTLHLTLAVLKGKEADFSPFPTGSGVV
ncbi:MAG: methyltransferase domain-containing protein [Clostridia bacterium]|nr:methyltransferase domain-containing protein [Clostridia bacterium]